VNSLWRQAASLALIALDGVAGDGRLDLSVGALQLQKGPPGDGPL
jgi:hypothetical protein